MKQRDALPRQVRGEGDLAVLHVEPYRRGKELKLPGGLQISILLRGGVLGRAHLLPDGVGVAVRLVDAVVLQQHALHARRNAADGHRRWSCGSWLVDIVIVPDKDSSLF